MMAVREGGEAAGAGRGGRFASHCLCERSAIDKERLNASERAPATPHPPFWPKTLRPPHHTTTPPLCAERAPNASRAEGRRSALEGEDDEAPLPCRTGFTLRGSQWKKWVGGLEECVGPQADLARALSKLLAPQPHP